MLSLPVIAPGDGDQISLASPGVDTWVTWVTAGSPAETVAIPDEFPSATGEVSAALTQGKEESRTQSGAPMSASLRIPVIW